MLRVAITRTMPDAERTAERVRAYGAEPIVAPLLTIKRLALDPALNGAQAIVFTSTNGVHAFAAVGGDRTCQVLAVGDATADAARACGFENVLSADGDVASLARLLAKTMAPGRLLHIGGKHVAGDLNELPAAGFSIERRIAYEAVVATTLPPELTGPLDIVLFHSARAAETFVGLGAPNAASRTAACLSEAVAAAARSAAWNRIIVAPAPREEALLDAALGAPDSPAGASA